MEVRYLKKFSKDLDKITQSKDEVRILEVIKSVKAAQSIEEIPGIKKLAGFDDAFRIRSGNYRLGVFVEESTVLFARVAHRKDIYKMFP